MIKQPQDWAMGEASNVVRADMYNNCSKNIYKLVRIQHPAIANLAQLVEHPTCNRTVEGSSPLVSILPSGAMVAQGAVNSEVIGSSPV